MLESESNHQTITMGDLHLAAWIYDRGTVPVKRTAVASPNSGMHVLSVETP